MPLGDYPAGVGPAGYDPVVPPSAPRRVRPPVSLHFDGATRDFILRDDGFYDEVHPVDQQVALALLISEGVVAAVPEVGNRLRTINRVPFAVARSTAKDYVNLALSGLLASKSIAIDKIDVEGTRGALFVAVTYRNLLARDPRARTARVPLAYA